MPTLAQSGCACGDERKPTQGRRAGQDGRGRAGCPRERIYMHFLALSSTPSHPAQLQRLHRGAPPHTAALFRLVPTKLPFSCKLALVLPQAFVARCGTTSSEVSLSLSFGGGLALACSPLLARWLARSLAPPSHLKQRAGAHVVRVCRQAAYAAHALHRLHGSRSACQIVRARASSSVVSALRAAVLRAALSARAAAAASVRRAAWST